MNHLDVLGVFENYTYVYYKEPNNRLIDEFDKVYKIIKASGHVVGSKWDLSGGILLESNDSVIAGIFFNTTEYDSAMLIHFAYVEPEFRKKGIYTTIHQYVDRVGNDLGKTTVYSYIHLLNTDMIDHVSKKIGYTPIMQVVSRPITKEDKSDLHK